MIKLFKCFIIKLTVLNLTEYITRCYGVTFQIIGYVKIKKFKDI